VIRIPFRGGTRRRREELPSIGFTRLIVRNEHIEWNTAAVVLIKMADSGLTSQLSFFKFNFGLYSNLSLQANSAVGCVCVCVFI